MAKRTRRKIKREDEKWSRKQEISHCRSLICLFIFLSNGLCATQLAALPLVQRILFSNKMKTATNGASVQAYLHGTVFISALLLLPAQPPKLPPTAGSSGRLGHRPPPPPSPSPHLTLSGLGASRRAVPRAFGFPLCQCRRFVPSTAARGGRRALPV
ncbi:uncharacterized protein VTP21DRAFT_11001 [Calcarisporiella thermophila]|uniref:uncharacterized protein n=1 Tax=Calcarisporiella thermophila TaxID=911321 RepID=UPI00374358C9